MGEPGSLLVLGVYRLAVGKATLCWSTCLAVAEFSKMKDELPESFKKGLEAMGKEREETRMATPTRSKEVTPSEKLETQVIKCVCGCALTRKAYTIQTRVRMHNFEQMHVRELSIMP